MSLGYEHLATLYEFARLFSGDVGAIAAQPNAPLGQSVLLEIKAGQTEVSYLGKQTAMLCVQLVDPSGLRLVSMQIGTAADQYNFGFWVHEKYPLPESRIDDYKSVRSCLERFVPDTEAQNALALDKMLQNPVSCLGSRVGLAVSRLFGD